MHITPSQMEVLEQVERAAIKKSNSKQPRFGKRPEAGTFFSSVMRWVEDSRLTEPPYEPDSRTRDTWLTSFWPKEPHLAGVLASVNSIDANRGWHLTGGRNQVQRFSRVFRNAEDGAGWRQYISLQSNAYYSTDIGAITETEREGTSDGPLANIYHLDSTKCFLTGKRSKPMKYDKSKEPWDTDDFFRLVSMRNIREEFNGLGLCAVSRVLDMSKIMLAIYNHELEQLGARAPRGLLLLQNIGQNQWIEAMKTRDAQLDSDMRKYYQAVAVIAQDGVDSIDAKLIALSQLPENFNIEVFTNLLLYAYALCIGYDPVEFWPVQQGQMGRGRETDIQHRKGTGKGGLNFMLAYQDQMLDQLPDSLSFEFEQRDQEGVLLDAEVAQAWANVVATLYGGGSSAAPGPAGPKGGDGEPVEASDAKVNPAANQVKTPMVKPILSWEECRQLLVNKGVIPAPWTEMEEDVSATDAKNVERQRRRDMLLSDERVLQAVHQYPNEPIVRYSWNSVTGKGSTEILFRNKEEALSRTRYSILKPAALIPDFSGKKEETEETKTEVVLEAPIVQKRIEGGFNIYKGDTPPLSVTVRDRKGKEVDVSSATEIVYLVYGRDINKPVIQKELGRGVRVERSVINIEFEPEDTLPLLGIYSHSVKVMDDLGRTFTVYQGDMAVLEGYIDA